MTIVWIHTHTHTHTQLYVTQDFGQTWSKVADYVRSPSDYQWGVPGFDPESSVVYFNTYDPNSPDGWSNCSALTDQILQDWFNSLRC